MSAVVIILAALSYLSRADCFTFSITRHLNSTKALPKNVWTNVEVLGTDDPNVNDVNVKVDIPIALIYSDVFMFFANDDKEILQLRLNDTVNGKFYTIPHEPIKEMKGKETTTVEKGDFHHITADFPKSWLPKGFNKISATVTNQDGEYYNYYGLQNFALSIPDLLVLEEFKTVSEE